MSFKLALNAGHGLYTPGKRCSKAIDPKETREWTLNSRICNKIEEKLKAYNGYSLIRLDDKTGKNDVGLTTRTNNANKFKADFYLAIHHNAGINGGSGGGIVAYVYTHVDDDTLDWQRKLYDSVIKYTGLKGNRSNPLAKADLHECRESNMPSVLIECGFMDSTTDVPIILTDDFADKVATACVEVLVSKGKLTKKSTSSNNDTSTTKPNTGTTISTPTKSIDELAKEVIAGKWGNGEARKTALTKAGYDYSAVQSKVNELMKSGSSKPSTPTKSIDELAKEVIAGKWGNGEARKTALTKAGYDYSAVQSKVNKLMKSGSFKPSNPTKSIDELAKEVIAGKWGNGNARKTALTKAGYDYSTIQARVNELLK